MNKQTQFIKVYSILTLKKVELFKRSKTVRLGLLCLFFRWSGMLCLELPNLPRNHRRTYHCTLDRIPKIFLQMPEDEFIIFEETIQGMDRWYQLHKWQRKNQEHACGKWQRWAWCKARKLFQQSIPFRGTLPAGTSGRWEFQTQHAWSTKKDKAAPDTRFLPFKVGMQYSRARQNTL